MKKQMFTSILHASRELGAMQFCPSVRRTIVALGTILFIFGLPLLLARGTSGGDEGAVLHFLYNLVGLEHGTIWLAYLAHQLFWLCEKYLFYYALHAVVPAEVWNNEIERSYLMVLDGSIFMTAACAYSAYNISKQTGSFQIAVLTTTAMFVSSSEVSLLSGGFIECAMALCVTYIAFNLDSGSTKSASGTVKLLLAGAVLIACKSYSIVFVLSLAPLLRTSYRTKVVYCVVALIVTLVLIEVRSWAMQGSAPDFYYAQISFPNVSTYLGRVAGIIASAPFGVIWSFPLLAFLFFGPRSNRSGILLKFVALLSVACVLCLFPFWHGAGGAGGPRYLLPFMLVLLPETAAAIRSLAGKWRLAVLVIPACAVLFLPAIEYRSSLINAYASERVIADEDWPLLDVGYHPAVFAWNVIRARQVDAATVTVGFIRRQTLSTIRIYPTTTLSRLTVALSGEHMPPQRGVAERVKPWLLRHRLDRIPWALGRTVLIVSFFSWLVWLSLNYVRIGSAASEGAVDGRDQPGWQ